MGDRAQVAIKSGNEKVYLYGHWIGANIYLAAGLALKEVPGRHHDSEYLARAVFCRMVPPDSLTEEAGFGIGTRIHSDIEHAVPVLDCDTQKVTFEEAGEHNGASYSFTEFATKALAGEFEDW